VAGLFPRQREGETAMRHGHSTSSAVGEPGRVRQPIGSTDKNSRRRRRETYEYTEMYRRFARALGARASRSVAKWLRDAGARREVSRRVASRGLDSLGK